MLGSVLGMSLGSATLYGVWHVLVKLRSHSVSAICIGQIIGGFICLIAGFFIQPFFITTKSFLVIITSGFLHALYLYLLAVAYQHGELSVIVPISRSFSILTIYALLMSFDDFFNIKFVGFLFVVFGSFFINYRDGVRVPNKSVLLSVVIGVLTVLYSFLDKQGIRFIHPFAFSSAMSLATGFFLLIFLFLVKFFLVLERPSLNKIDVFFGFIIGVTGLAIYSTFLALLNHMPLSFAMATRQFSIIVSTIFGYFILKERFTLAKIFSLFLLIFGVTLLGQDI